MNKIHKYVMTTRRCPKQMGQLYSTCTKANDSNGQIKSS